MINILKNLVCLIDDRYEILAESKRANFKDYNAIASRENQMPAINLRISMTGEVTDSKLIPLINRINLTGKCAGVQLEISNLSMGAAENPTE